MAGNVWQWTSDWYRPDYYEQLAAQGGIALNPQGPDSSYDPSEPGQEKRAAGRIVFVYEPILQPLPGRQPGQR